MDEQIRENTSITIGTRCRCLSPQPPQRRTGYERHNGTADMTVAKAFYMTVAKAFYVTPSETDFYSLACRPLLFHEGDAQAMQVK